MRAKSQALKLVVLGGLFGGCAVGLEDGPVANATQEALAEKEAPVIVGEVDWVEAGTLPTNDVRRVAGRPVALLWLPAAGSRCTGTLIGMDVLMTNEHCVSSQAEAQGAFAVFDAESGVPDSLRENVDCGTFIGANAALDFALLRCTNRPGERHGVAALFDGTVANNTPVFVVHQNCDYFLNQSCTPDKKVSSGIINSRSSTDYDHSADTLGGSSGSAMFDAQGRIVGLHHLGIGGNSLGRGSSNRAVRMDVILPVLRRDFASIFDGGNTTGTPPPPAVVPPPVTDPTLDTLEPNNDTGSATPVARPFAAQGLFVATQDRDMFKVTLAQAATLTVNVAFSHAAGDLDIYLFRSGSNRNIARSTGTSDQENISLALSAGTYFVMVLGYQGAQGAYDISVR